MHRFCSIDTIRPGILGLMFQGILCIFAEHLSKKSGTFEQVKSDNGVKVYIVRRYLTFNQSVSICSFTVVAFVSFRSSVSIGCFLRKRLPKSLGLDLSFGLDAQTPA